MVPLAPVRGRMPFVITDHPTRLAAAGAGAAR
jgi:hypothetical protein